MNAHTDKTQWNIAHERLEIMHLVYRCADAADQRDAETFSNCYLPDGVFDRSGTILHGRDEISAGLHQRQPGHERRHIFSNLQVHLHDAERATGQSYCLVFDRRKDGPAGLPPDIVDIKDEYLKIDGNWYISLRVAQLAFNSTT